MFCIQQNAYNRTMQIAVATQNEHKLRELKAILDGYTLLSPREAGVDFTYEETGSTFLENSLGKALHLHRLTGLPSLADDSGLSVPSMDGEPGVRSARYGSDIAGRLLDSPERNEYLLEKMKALEDRKAFFVCCITLVVAPYRQFSAQETLEGEITYEPRGSEGFGYDPLFFLPTMGCTVAELSSGKKNELSHRGKAATALSTMLAKVTF